MGTMDPFILRGEGSRATMQNTQIFHISGPGRWKTGVPAKQRGKPNYLGCSIRGAPAKFEILKVLKLLFLRAED